MVRDLTEVTGIWQEVPCNLKPARRRGGIIQGMRYVWLLALVSCALGDEHTKKQTLQERTYYVHVPPNLSRPAPVVFVFHGGGGRAEHAMKYGFDPISDREGFLVVYPDAGTGLWNDGREFTKSDKDDLAFVKRILQEIGTRYEIDSRRVFATGISNGGIFSHHLGANLSEHFAAIAPVVGGMSDGTAANFRPAQPVHVLVIQGTDDPLVPFNGGVIARNRGRIVSTEEAVNKWRAHNGCDERGKEEALPDRDPRDGCRAKRTRWSGRADVELIVIEGGGHTWPNGAQYLPRAVIGRVCRDFDGPQLIWEFFAAHPKK